MKDLLKPFSFSLRDAQLVGRDLQLQSMRVCVCRIDAVHIINFVVVVSSEASVIVNFTCIHVRLSVRAIHSVGDGFILSIVSSTFNIIYMHAYLS